jgi:hypothetical protein
MLMQLRRRLVLYHPRKIEPPCITVLELVVGELVVGGLMVGGRLGSGTPEMEHAGTG